MAKVLLVDDDITLTVMLADAVQSVGHAVDIAHTAAAAEDHLVLADYDLIVLDWQLPDGSGYDLCLSWRRKKITTPILFLTSRSEVDSIVNALDAGAEDYLTKPFDVRELIVRLQAVLRCQETGAADLVCVGNLELNTGSHELRNGDTTIKLQPMEFALLDHFMRNPGSMFTVDLLQKLVWKDRERSSNRGVYASITRLKTALAAAGLTNLISTEHGRGYGIKPDKSWQ